MPLPSLRLSLRRAAHSATSAMSRPSLTTFSTTSSTARTTYDVRISNSRFIRLHHVNSDNPHRRPCVVFVPGFMKWSACEEATYLAEHCSSRGHEFIAYDPEALGESSGQMASVEFQDWIEDCQAAINFTSNSRICLVGSSMGGLISLKMSLLFPRRISSLVLISPAVNVLYPMFMQWYVDEFSDEGRDRVDKGKVYEFETFWGRLPVRKEFFENMRKHDLDTKTPFNITCPIRIFHGMRDADVPIQNSLELMDVVQSKDVALCLRKNAEHRFVEAEDLKMVASEIDDILV